MLQKPTFFMKFFIIGVSFESNDFHLRSTQSTRYNGYHYRCLLCQRSIERLPDLRVTPNAIAAYEIHAIATEDTPFANAPTKLKVRIHRLHWAQRPPPWAQRLSSQKVLQKKTIAFVTARHFVLLHAMDVVKVMQSMIESMVARPGAQALVMDNFTVCLKQKRSDLFCCC